MFKDDKFNPIYLTKISKTKFKEIINGKIVWHIGNTDEIIDISNLNNIIDNYKMLNINSMDISNVKLRKNRYLDFTNGSIVDLKNNVTECYEYNYKNNKVIVLKFDTMSYSDYWDFKIYRNFMYYMII